MNYLLLFGTFRTIITVFASLVLFKYYVYLVLAPFYRVKQAWWRFSLGRRIKKGQAPAVYPVPRNAPVSNVISSGINPWYGVYHPLVSIIIPACNEEVGIIPTIQSALANTYPKVEVIVVTNGSEDNTNRLVRKFKEKYNANKINGKSIKFFSLKEKGKGLALNFGVQHAKGEIVMTMDADSLHHPRAVENLVRYFQDPMIDAVVGNVKVSANPTSLVGYIQRLEYLFGFYFKRVHSLFDAEYIFGGACAAFRKTTTFDAIGLFDTQNKTEDIEYSMRCKLFGLRAVYAEDVITYTEGASTLRGLYKQRLRWKKGRLDTFIKYRSLFLSTDKRHSRFLSWFILPYAILGELQMLFEPMFFTLIWSYTFISGDYLSVGLSSLFILFTYFAACFLGDRKADFWHVLTFPFTWPLFYLLTGIEFLALIKSLDLVLSSQDVAWQNWSRQGIETPEPYLLPFKIAYSKK